MPALLWVKLRLQNEWDWKPSSQLNFFAKSLQVENHAKGILGGEKEKGKIKRSKQQELICIAPYLEAPAPLQSPITAIGRSRMRFNSHLYSLKTDQTSQITPPCGPYLRSPQRFSHKGSTKSSLAG